MYPTMFLTCLKRTGKAEGGLSMDPTDRGNWTSGKCGVGELRGTKYGLAAMTYPNEDIAGMTESRRDELYLEWYTRCKIDKLCNVLQYQMFDAAFNHGLRNASKFFQRAVGATDDGAIGPATLAQAALMDENDKAFLFLAERAEFFTKCKTWPQNGKGWISHRIVENLRYAAEDN